MEIKSAMTYHSDFQSGVRYFQKLNDTQTLGRVIYAGELEFDTEYCQVVQFENAFGADT
jgi:hypothetical protein